LDEGGMAVVYKAYDTHLECEVAVKVIRSDIFPPNVAAKALKRFEREAKSVAKLDHPNIVKVIDYGEFAGSPYLVMPFLKGGTLRTFLQKKGQLSWKQAFTLILPIVNALQYAHNSGVIHRDIKPSNILLTETGQPLLSDFGIAKIIDDEDNQALTSTATALGTAEYMAPEQVTSKTTDFRADIYAVGIVLFEMITGQRPFEADTPLAVLFKHASDPLPRPKQFVKDLPDFVENILFKALAKRPDDRYQSMRELEKAMLYALNQVAAEPLVAGGVLTKPDPLKTNLETQISSVDLRTMREHVENVKNGPSLNSRDKSKNTKILWPWFLLLGVIFVLFAGLIINYRLSGERLAETPQQTAAQPTIAPQLNTILPTSTKSVPTLTKTTTQILPTITQTLDYSNQENQLIVQINTPTIVNAVIGDPTRVTASVCAYLTNNSTSLMTDFSIKLIVISNNSTLLNQTLQINELESGKTIAKCGQFIVNMGKGATPFSVEVVSPYYYYGWGSTVADTIKRYNVVPYKDSFWISLQ
jgi:serine/threonine protein kinase